MEILINPARLRTRGPFYDPPLLLNNNIMVGPGSFLTPAFVAKNDITHIINVAEATSAPEWIQQVFAKTYTFIPCEDSMSFDIFGQYPMFKAAMTSYLHDPMCGKVYVHCQAGMNRSATLAIAYVIKTYDLVLEQVVFFALRQRPCILANPFFNQKLIEFVKKNK